MGSLKASQHKLQNSILLGQGCSLSLQLVEDIWNLDSVIHVMEYFPQYHIYSKLDKYAPVVETSLGHINFL